MPKGRRTDPEGDSRVPAPLRGFDPDTFETFLNGRVATPTRILPALSMFSNAGIGDFGYRLAGFTFHAHGELHKKRLAICKHNHPRSADIEGDLRKTKDKLIRAYRERARDRRPALLTGMSPCQGMSSASAWARKGTEGPSKDPRNALAFLLADVADALKPRIVVVENVPSILTTRIVDPLTDEEGYVADLLAKRLKDYVGFPVRLQLADFGIPQRRRRALFTFIHKDEPCLQKLEKAETVPYPRRTHDVTKRLGLLPWITVREFLSPERFKPLDSKSFAKASDPTDPLHYVPAYEPERYDLVRMIPPYSGKSAYDSDVCPHCKKSGQPREVVRCNGCGGVLHMKPLVLEKKTGQPRLIIGHNTSYKRMPPDLPASTITTANGHLGSDTKIHPWENRLLSPRECAALQTIPKTFTWAKPGTIPERPHTDVLRQTIGEALPPWFSYLHGLALNSLLRGALVAPYLMPAHDPAVEPHSAMSAIERAKLRKARLHQHSGRARRLKRLEKEAAR